MSAYELIFQDLHLEGKTVLDAATGAGEATAAWAKYIREHRLNARIVSVDDRVHGDGYMCAPERYVLKSYQVPEGRQ